MTRPFPAFAALFQGLARFRKLLLWVFFTLLVFAYTSLFRSALIDDAFITLQYAKTLLGSGTWGFYPGHVSNTATSPLNVLLLAGVALVTGPSEAAAVVLASASFVGLTFVLARLSHRLFGVEEFGYLASGAVLFNPLLVSTIGLESLLLLTLLMAALYAYAAGKWGWMGALLALVTLTRPEGVLFFLLFWAFTPGARQKRRVALLYALVCAPWFLYSWIHLGSLLPDTFFIKIARKSWEQWSFANGLGLYLKARPWVGALAFFPLPLGLILLPTRGARSVRVLVLAGWSALAHFAGYTLLSVPPYHWYYTPTVGLAILVSVFGLGALWSQTREPGRRELLLKGAFLLFVALPGLGMASILLRDGAPLPEAPIHTNWATQGQYREIGGWLSENHRGQVIALDGEIGTLAFFCDCHLLDGFSHRRWMDRYVANLVDGDGLLALLFRLNFAFYRPSAPFPPPAYTLTGRAGHPGSEAAGSEERAPVRIWETSTRWVPQGQVILEENKP